LRSLGWGGRRALVGFWLALLATVLVLLRAPLGTAAEEREQSAPTPEPAITKVQRYASDDAARIVLHVSRPVQFQKGEGAGAPLHVDVGRALYSGPHAYELGGLVRSVRLLPLDGGYRIAIDAAAPAKLTAFYLPEPFRIVIDLTRLDERSRSDAAPGRGRRVERIALDPGHGGADPGAMGEQGVREKDVALDIAHRAAPLLARELGVSTLLTRDSDVRVPLEERVARANAFRADLFISIHCNAERTGTARGVMSFVLDGSHQRGAAVVGMVAQENATARTDDAEFARFLSQFDDSRLADRSVTFATLLQRATLASLAAGYPEAVDGGVHGAGFYVLVGAGMPAVLFETSFVSNLLEERRLGSGRYRQKLADAIVNAVRAYRAGYPAPRAAGPRAVSVR
jgi:N-acetylmuramoyl-L-alanine amidase